MEAAEGQSTTVGPPSSRGGRRRNATSRRPRGEAVGWMGWQDGPGRMGQDGSRMGMTWASCGWCGGRHASHFR